VAGTHLAGELDLDHLRGRSGLAMPVQAAEAGLRRQLEETRNDAVRFLGATRRDDVTAARFDVAGTTYAVRVRTSHGDDQRLTCQAVRDNPVPVHDLLDVTTYS
jgi:hypothetical protein